MINLSKQLCNELGLYYWQLKPVKDEVLRNKHEITREEKELLRKILLAKGVKLDDSMLEIREGGIVMINSLNYQLIFNNVYTTDTNNIVNLAKIFDMLTDPEQKKLTWYKLKNIDLYSKP